VLDQPELGAKFSFSDNYALSLWSIEALGQLRSGGPNARSDALMIP
jgi:hypothetical protein